MNPVKQVPNRRESTHCDQHENGDPISRPIASTYASEVQWELTQLVHESMLQSGLDALGDPLVGSKGTAPSLSERRKSVMRRHPLA